MSVRLAWRVVHRERTGMCPLTGLDVEEKGIYWLHCPRTLAPVAMNRLARVFPRHRWTQPRPGDMSQAGSTHVLRAPMDTAGGAWLALARWTSMTGPYKPLFTAMEREQLALKILGAGSILAVADGLPGTRQTLGSWLQHEASLGALRQVHNMGEEPAAALAGQAPMLEMALARLASHDINAALPAGLPSRRQERL